MGYNIFIQDQEIQKLEWHNKDNELHVTISHNNQEILNKM